jgi:large subunit ribosomal protein L18
MYAQVIDDQRHVTLAYASTLEADVGVSVAKANKVEQAKRVGSLVAKRCLELGVTQVVFDRSGFVYHGRIAAVAQAARESGLAF